MTIQTGVYLLYTSKTNTFLGKASRGEWNVEPKPVFTNMGPKEPNQKWVVEQLPNGNCYLYANFSPTTATSGCVFALVVDQVRRTEWRLVRGREGSIIIEDPTSGLVWTCPSFEENIQVELKPLREDEKGQVFTFDVIF